MFKILVGDVNLAEEIFDITTDTKITMYADEVVLPELEEQAGNNGLFPETKLFVLHGFLENKDSEAWLWNQLDAGLFGNHHLVLVEQKLLAGPKKKLAKHQPIIKEKKRATAGRDDSVFAITNALLVRDRKTAWVEYRKAIMAGKAPEEIMGLLWWQAKTMWMVAKLGEKSGVKPFVLNKSKQAVQKYGGEAGVKKLAKKIVATYHDARLGGIPLEEGCERLLLSI